MTRIAVLRSGLAQPPKISNGLRAIAEDLQAAGYDCVYLTRTEKITPEVMGRLLAAPAVALGGHSNGAYRSSMDAASLPRQVSELWLVDPFVEPFWHFQKPTVVPPNVQRGYSRASGAPKPIVPAGAQWCDEVISNGVWHGSMDELPQVRETIFNWFKAPA